MDLTYKLVQKNELAIITLKGNLSRSSEESLIKCTGELLQTEAKVIILYLKEVSTIDKFIHRQLALLQQEARKGRKLYICGINPHLKQELLDKGIIRFNEVKGSLEDILKEL